MDKRDHEDSAKVGATKRARTDEKEDEIEPIEAARPTIPAAAEGSRINKTEELKSKEEKQSQGPFHDLKIASHVIDHIIIFFFPIYFLISIFLMILSLIVLFLFFFHSSGLSQNTGYCFKDKVWKVQHELQVLLLHVSPSDW